MRQVPNSYHRWNQLKIKRLNCRTHNYESAAENTGAMEDTGLSKDLFHIWPKNTNSKRKTRPMAIDQTEVSTQTKQLPEWRGRLQNRRALQAGKSFKGSLMEGTLYWPQTRLSKWDQFVQKIIWEALLLNNSMCTWKKAEFQKDDLLEEWVTMEPVLQSKLPGLQQKNFHAPLFLTRPSLHLFPEKFQFVSHLKTSIIL